MKAKVVSEIDGLLIESLAGVLGDRLFVNLFEFCVGIAVIANLDPFGAGFLGAVMVLIWFYRGFSVAEFPRSYSSRFSRNSA